MIDPMLHDTGQLGAAGHQERKLVQDQWPLPVASLGLLGQRLQNRAPVPERGLLEDRKTAGQCLAEVAALDLGRRLIRDRVQAVMPSVPFNKEARLPDTPPPRQNGQAALAAPAKAIKAFHLLTSADEFHSM